MDISKVTRRGLSMQDLVGGDNNRTPAIFRVLDNLVFVGDIHGSML